MRSEEQRRRTRWVLAGLSDAEAGAVWVSTVNQSGRERWSSVTPACQRSRRRWAGRPEANLFAGSTNRRRGSTVRQRLSYIDVLVQDSRDGVVSRRHLAPTLHRQGLSSAASYHRSLPAFRSSVTTFPIYGSEFRNI